LKDTEEVANVDVAQESLAKAEMRNGRLTMVFKRQGKGTVTFSTQPLTYRETW
jgi:hypothetical protein